MAEQDQITVAREYVESFTAGDWSRLRATLAPDAVYEEPATHRRVQGADSIVEAWQGWRQAFPDAKGTVTNAVAGDNQGVLEVAWEGTQNGPPAGAGVTIPPSGKRVQVGGGMIFTFQGDKIKELHNYFDLMTILQQIGASAP
ncbi:MAG TPA: ester cyclase [Dehalococcoidia bacterium]|jgi:steroid delta-isomerase-like uncharacterized protein|nr:ester cyclase [Dehalococcoidia bacterium]